MKKRKKRQMSPLPEEEYGLMVLFPYGSIREIREEGEIFRWHQLLHIPDPVRLRMQLDLEAKDVETS